MPVCARNAFGVCPGQRWEEVAPGSARRTLRVLDVDGTYATVNVESAAGNLRRRYRGSSRIRMDRLTSPGRFRRVSERD